MKEYDGIYYFNSDTFVPHQIKVQYGSVRRYADLNAIPYIDLVLMLKGEDYITPRYKNIFIETLDLKHANSRAKLNKFIDRADKRCLLNKMMSSTDVISKYELLEMMKFLNADKG